MAIFNSKLFVYQRLSFEVIKSFIMASAYQCIKSSMAAIFDGEKPPSDIPA